MQQLLDLDTTPCASSPSHLSLKILLTLSLINRWDVITTNTSSASIQANKANDELVLVQPPPELQQDPDVLWQLTKALYGIKTDLKHWQQSLASQLEDWFAKEQGRTMHLHQ